MQPTASNLHDAAGDFVTGNAGIGGAAPFAARRVDVGMADAAKENFDLNVGWPGVAPLERERGER
jgi:hypothetical protein